MEIKLLNTSSLTAITSCFNLAFSDYSIPIQLTKEQLHQKILVENIDLALSVGVFDDQQLVAFILHAKKEVDQTKEFYNAGTGVIPSHRGKGLSVKMYDFILPQLKKQQFSKGSLEVITSNAPAIHTYKKVGFKIVQELACFKGSAQLQTEASPLEVQRQQPIDWKTIERLLSWESSWQNSLNCLQRLKKAPNCILIKQNHSTVGFALYNDAGKIYLLDSHVDQPTSLTQLLNFIDKDCNNPLLITNIPLQYKYITTAFSNNKFDNFLNQYQLLLEL